MNRHFRLDDRPLLPAGLERPGRRTTVAAGSGGAVKLLAGSRAHVVNTIGQQVADMWALALPDGASYLSTSHSRLATGRLSPKAGDVLVDNQRRPLIRVLADTSPGGHDTLIPACDAQRYRDLGFDGEHRNCTANFHEATSSHGLGDLCVPEPVNLFMSVLVAADGSLTLEASQAGSEDEVVLEALRDILLVISACPQDLVPISGSSSAPRQVDIYSD